MKKRAASQRLTLEKIQNGQFIPTEEDFELNYLITEDAQKVYRVKVVGTVVTDPHISDDTAYGRVQLDDGSDTIFCSVFREDTLLLENIKAGDIVQAIGKIREWQGEKQLTLEAISPVVPNFLLLHRLELMKSRREHEIFLEKARRIYQEEGENLRQARERAKKEGVPADVVEALDELKYAKERGEEPELPKVEVIKDKVLSLIEKKPEGAEMDVIQAAFADQYSAEEIEEAIRDLLSVGEIFEKRINVFVKV